MTRVASFVVLLAIIVVIGILFYRVMASFVLPLFMAGFLVVIFQPLHHRIQQRFPNRPQLAAGATTAAVMVIVLLPVALFVCFAIIEGVDLAGRVNAATVKARLVKLRES
ncbi:MAG: hypothetical protein QF805_28220, partial [Pirellulaceae bacterium]|nr:hypothetical protein [Pirellulaceae bacterium]